MKYVIGGGLAGLLTGYYNPEYTILSPEPSGFVESKIGRAFVVIHENKDTRALFQDLGVTSFQKEITLGYYDDPGFAYDPDFAFGERYLRRKLPESFIPDDIQLGGAPGSEFSALFIDDNIIAELARRVDIKYGWATRIGDGFLKFRPERGPPEILEYEDLISTIPATKFYKLIDTDPEWILERHPMTYMEVESIPRELRARPWNYLYIASPEYSYHRVVKTMISDHYFVECRGDIRKVELPNEQTPIDRYVHPEGVIKAELLDYPYGIRPIGRWAEWDPDVLATDVIATAKHEVKQ